MDDELLKILYCKSIVLKPGGMGEGNEKDEMIRWFDHRKFAELVAEECRIEIERLTIRNGDTEHNRALSAAWYAITKKFGLKK